MHTLAGMQFDRMSVDRMVALRLSPNDFASSPVTRFALLVLERLYGKSHFVIEREFKNSEGTIFELPLRGLKPRGVADDTLALVADERFSRTIIWERLDGSSSRLSAEKSTLNIESIFFDPDLLFSYVLETKAGRALKQAQRENSLLGAARLCCRKEGDLPVDKEGLIVSESILNEVWERAESRKIKLQGEEISCFALEFTDSLILGVGIGFKETWRVLSRAPLLEGAGDGGTIELQQVEFCSTDVPSTPMAREAAVSAPQSSPPPPRPSTPVLEAPTTLSALVETLSKDQSLKPPLEALLNDREMLSGELMQARDYLTMFSTAHLVAFNNGVECAQAHIGRLTITQQGLLTMKRSALLMSRAAWPKGIQLPSYVMRTDLQKGRNEEEGVILIECRPGSSLDDCTALLLFSDALFQNLVETNPDHVSFNERGAQEKWHYILDKWSPPPPS